MLERLEGTIQAIEEQKVIVQSDYIGFGIYVPNVHAFTVGESASFHLHLVWNQETGPSLYGFGLPLEKSVFIVIISCIGVGPKLGLAILDKLGAHGFLEAIQTGNEDALSSVSGIGAKKAEQIIVQCKHKVNKLIASGINCGTNTQLARWYEVDQALSSLNYSRNEITRALDYIKIEQQSTSISSFDHLLRKALSYLAQKQ
jgi:Holliday junction DNA helicase RuvA